MTECVAVLSRTATHSSHPHCSLNIAVARRLPTATTPTRPAPRTVPSRTPELPRGPRRYTAQGKRHSTVARPPPAPAPSRSPRSWRSYCDTTSRPTITPPYSQHRQRIPLAVELAHPNRQSRVRRESGPAPPPHTALPDPARPDLSRTAHSHKTWLIATGIPEIAQARRLGHRFSEEICCAGSWPPRADSPRVGPVPGCGSRRCRLRRW